MMDQQWDGPSPTDGPPDQDRTSDGPEPVPSRLSATSRRDFIKGVIVSGIAASAGGVLFRGSARAAVPAPAGTVERLLTLQVNGQKRRVDILPQETLAQTLRNKLGLTGTKVGCDRGECGACTVLVDDVATYSCSTLTHQVRGRRITTIEGLGGPHGEMHRVQKAFIAELAPQCGFCTPGQIMTAVALLKANPHPTAAEIRQAMSGNLCRCGAYNNYLKGVLRAAAEA